MGSRHRRHSTAGDGIERPRQIGEETSAKSTAETDPSTDDAGGQRLIWDNTLVMSHFDPGQKTAKLNHLVQDESYSQ